MRCTRPQILSDTQVETKLKIINEFNPNMTTESRRQLLSEIETCRNLQIWHDASSISNHGHIVMMVNILYDTAVYYTDEEYYELFNERKNIQMIIEKPELYIIGRCRANDEQIMYIKTRIQVIIGMQPIYTTDNVKIQDNLRYFHGDGPAAQFECGNQKMGHYFCVSCNVSSFMIEDFAPCGYQKIVDLKDRLMKINEGHWARKHTLKEKLHPFKELNKQEIIEELISRKIYDINTNRKCEIEKILKKEMRGIQRVPSLLYHNPLITFLNKHLAKYEISSIEPMHDICGHIKNIFTELPSVLNENEKKVFNEIYQITIRNKQCKSACDYRLALLDIVLVMKNILQSAILELLLTLVEIQRICYSPEKERTSKQILKLYNITFKHVYIMKNLFRKVNKISWGKLYGKYFYQIICHGTQQYRLVSGTASNCEQKRGCLIPDFRS